MRRKQRRLRRKAKKEAEERLKAEQEAEKDKSGKKTKRPRSRARKESPRLDNVDIVEYERWLAETISANMDSFLSKKHNGSDSEFARVNDMVSSYLSSIKKLRIGLVKVRQKAKLEFK